jgi:hypothetical protein
VLLSIGLIISVPLVIYGATVLMRLIEPFPGIVVLGGALIGYIAGEVAVTDPALERAIDAAAPWLVWAAPTLCSFAVVLVGRLTAGMPARDGADTTAGTLVGAAGAFLLRVVGRLLVAAAVLVAARLGIGDPTQLPWATAVFHVLEPLAPILVAIAATAIVEAGMPPPASRAGPSS